MTGIWGVAAVDPVARVPRKEVTLDTELSTEKETGEQERGGPAVLRVGGEHSGLGQKLVPLDRRQLTRTSLTSSGTPVAEVTQSPEPRLSEPVSPSLRPSSARRRREDGRCEAVHDRTITVGVSSINDILKQACPMTQ